jgi:hypothetical protein
MRHERHGARGHAGDRRPDRGVRRLAPAGAVVSRFLLGPALLLVLLLLVFVVAFWELILDRLR